MTHGRSTLFSHESLLRAKHLRWIDNLKIKNHCRTGPLSDRWRRYLSTPYLRFRPGIRRTSTGDWPPLWSRTGRTRTRVRETQGTEYPDTEYGSQAITENATCSEKVNAGICRQTGIRTEGIVTYGFPEGAHCSQGV